MDLVAVVIKSITQDTEHYEIGTNNIVSIQATEQGPKRLYMFEITYADGGVLFVGFIDEPEIEYMEG